MRELLQNMPVGCLLAAEWAKPRYSGFHGAGTRWKWFYCPTCLCHKVLAVLWSLKHALSKPQLSLHHTASGVNETMER